MPVFRRRTAAVSCAILGLPVMNDQTRSYFHALLAVLFWSTVASAFKLVLRRTDFLTLLFYSSLFST